MTQPLTIHVLLRFSKRTGQIDTAFTSLGNALMKFWALDNTPKSKSCIIAERDTGKIVYITEGTENDFPKVLSEEKDGNLGTVEDFGISVDVLKAEFVDDRFDN